jgi:hypothetical protein
MNSESMDAVTITTAQAAVWLEVSERQLYRVGPANGIVPTAGRWPAKRIVDLAIDRAIAGSESATRLRLQCVTERLREVEAQLREALG